MDLDSDYRSTSFHRLRCARAPQGFRAVSEQVAR